MDEFVFRPVRRVGTLFQSAMLVVLIIAGVAGFWLAFQVAIGAAFLLSLLPVLFAFVSVPVLAYRFYALQQATYALEREGIRLRWGLRLEEIPIANVLWVNLASELSTQPPSPRLSWPGGVLGHRHLAGIGEVEFLASSTKDLVVIATHGKYYAISPETPETFVLAFQRCIEMGSLFPIPARSVYPTFILNRVWQSRLARALLLSGASLSLALLVWVSLAIPGRSQVIFGFRPDGLSGDLAPAARLLLLPILNSFFFLTDLFLGLFYFRREEGEPVAYLLWGAGVLTPLFFLIAVGFMLQAS
jgi:Bacterial PH domain